MSLLRRENLESLIWRRFSEDLKDAQRSKEELLKDLEKVKQEFNPQRLTLQSFVIETVKNSKERDELRNEVRKYAESIELQINFKC